MGNKLINLENISKSYGSNLVLDEMNLYINENEFLTLLGPSGCGKTTTLRIIGGFETPDTGKVIFEGKDITNLAPNKRQVNTVFQKYALFPHMTIAENIAFGLKIKKKSKSYIDDKIKYALKLVNLEDFANRMPDSLSGGQQQRIAIARAIVNEPKVLLLDEPVAGMGKAETEKTGEIIRNIATKYAVVVVEHDMEFVRKVADTVTVMHEGKILVEGTADSVLADEQVKAVYLGRGKFHKSGMAKAVEEKDA